ncbi:Di- and tricarboxylate transporters [Mesorhizobium sp. J18]|uniref:SLC13 family permease n=1 Tax=Mesorhizobium sp. J18 TaxID=935263 RepID=UPI0011995897|nr:SLC13 family permease [Mesorhizobium sp. J18]TWG97027.1 Di- and tricarboxylate transporters [Mesorhizobium sp. J18]
MTFDQALIVILLVCMLVIFALDRFRIELVALTGLAAGLVFGLVPMSEVFSGFANPAVVTVIEILLIVQVLGRANLLDRVAARISSGVRGDRGVLLVLCGLTGALSVFMNNIGALALMLPVVLSTCRMTGMKPRSALMPVSFAALLGGLCSLIGTPANLLVSQALQAETGRGFAFFDFAYAGVPVAIISILAIVAWIPLIFASGRKTEAGEEPASGRVVAEALIPAESRIAGAAIADVPNLTGGMLHAAIRDGKHLFLKRRSTKLMAGDTLLLELDLGAFERAIAAGDLALPSQTRLERADRAEAVIMPESTLVGSRIATLELFHARDIRVVAVASQSHRIEGRLNDLQLGIGDILFLAGDKDAIAEALEEAGLMLLSPLRRLETAAPAYFPLAVFAGGIGLTALGAIPPEIAFGLVVLVLAATGRLNLRTGLAELNWPILIMLAAMIPLGLAMDTTGAAQVMAESLLAAVPSHEPVSLIAMVLVLALIITPFANNASTAVVLAPIAIEIARSASLPPELFLIALALGISIDFLTPFGHHNNTIVMSVGNYSFIDFLKAGFPITIVAVLAAIAAVMAAWL